VVRFYEELSRFVFGGDSTNVCLVAPFNAFHCLMTAVGLLEAGSVKFIIIFKLRKSFPT
jgi:hypothetical protein